MYLGHDDTQWAAVSRATQLQARYRTELRRHRHQQARLRAARWLVRTGMRLAGGAVTGDRLLGPSTLT